MAELVVRLLLGALGVYAALGLVFAVPFALFGAARIDPGARGAPWGFKLLLLPGAAALWPLLAWRLARGGDAEPAERTAHRRAAGEGR